MKEIINNRNKKRFEMKNVDGSPQWWRGYLIGVGETIITDNPWNGPSFEVKPEELNKKKTKEG